ncbi:hypothetical protein DFH27DRAFT_646029 [Peziza echinospora]|nr:hypothetical protein DFH27DRAFT_646029 [Peziza echinospora]
MVPGVEPGMDARAKDNLWRHMTDRASLWRKLVSEQFPKLKRLKLDYFPSKEFPRDAMFRSNYEPCGTTVNIFNAQQRQDEARGNFEMSFIDTPLMEYYIPLAMGIQASLSLGAGQNIHHMEFSSVEDDLYSCRRLADGKYVESTVPPWLMDVGDHLSKALAHGALQNFKSLTVMNGYAELLTFIPRHTLKKLKISRWYNLQPLVRYLGISDCHKHVPEGEDDTTLTSLTLDLLPGNTERRSSISHHWGNDKSHFRRYFGPVDISLLYDILSKAPNLKNLVLRRGDFKRDAIWLLLVMDLILDWEIQVQDDKVISCIHIDGYTIPPLHHNLESLSIESWGQSLREFILRILRCIPEKGKTIDDVNKDLGLKSIIHLPNIRRLKFTPAQSELRYIRRHREHTSDPYITCLTRNPSGTDDTPDCYFCGFRRKREGPLAEQNARAEDDAIIQAARKHGISVEEELEMEHCRIDMCTLKQPCCELTMTRDLLLQGMYPLSMYHNECLKHVWTFRGVENHPAGEQFGLMLTNDYENENE